MPLKFLLVESDGHLLEKMAEALTREGFTVLTAQDGHQALQRWHADRPDLIVLEVDLPPLGGLDICRQVRASGSTPVILLSAQTADEQVVEGFRAGADEYLGTPVSPPELALWIRTTWRQVTGTEVPS